MKKISILNSVLLFLALSSHQSWSAQTFSINGGLGYGGSDMEHARVPFLEFETGFSYRHSDNFSLNLSLSNIEVAELIFPASHTVLPILLSERYHFNNEPGGFYAGAGVAVAIEDRKDYLEQDGVGYREVPDGTWVRYGVGAQMGYEFVINQYLSITSQATFIRLFNKAGDYSVASVAGLTTFNF